MRRLLMGLVAIILVLAIWGAGIEPRLIDHQEETALVPGLPAGWQGREIGLVADLQVGMWGANTRTIENIVSELVDRRPAAVLIAGDFIYGAQDDSTEVIREAVELVAPLPAAGIPTLAVLGNHDYSIANHGDPPDEGVAAQLREALDEAGVRVLGNEAVALPAPRDPAAAGSGRGEEALYVVGVDSEWAATASPERALAGVPDGAAAIWLMHNPSTFERIPADAAPLALAAHTHGGQIRLPFTPDWSWLTFAKEDAVHADGWIDGYGRTGNRLFVSRGIGFSDLPVRINNRPVVTVFTLRRGSRDRD